jgi:UDP:flavonoid glycosyltransferase YjiC (YdhE family)
MRFDPAPEYDVFPTPARPLKPYEAAVRAARDTQPLIREFDPEVVVADILTVAGALAAELEERPWVTLVPHVLPTGEPGFPVYSVGAVYPRTAVGAAVWRRFRPMLMKGEEQGRRELNGARERLGLPPLDYVHGGISRQLSLIATFPQLEYPRREAMPWARVTGPLLWELPAEEVEPPPGDEPLVLVAPSTSQDPENGLVRAALEGLADEPVRVLAVVSRRDPSGSVRAPRNAKLVDWLRYSQAMPRCAAVICHAGHGTIGLALRSGTPIVACPHAGDMAETSARIRWAGAGVALPRRFHTPRGVRLALRRLMSEPSYAARARELGEWAKRNDGPRAAAEAIEQLLDGSARQGERIKLPGWESNPQPLD